jgi:hypothetical protein
MKRAALLLAFVPGLALAGERTSWLEAGTLVNWNKAGAELPTPPAAPSADPRCVEQARPAVSKDDKAVAAAGWTLVGAAQVFGRTRAFLGAAGFDGMCRPHDFQGFVFVDGKLAGTLSPQPMRSRSDGALTTLRLVSELALSVDFARYLEQDPLCCPSRLSNVSYKIETGDAGPLLVPSLARVDAAPAPPR